MAVDLVQNGVPHRQSLALCTMKLATTSARALNSPMRNAFSVFATTLFVVLSYVRFVSEGNE